MNLKRTTGTLLLLGGVGVAAAAGCSAGAEGTGETLESVSVVGTGVSGNLTLQSDWTQGYCANVTITNTGSTATTSWQAVINLNQASVTSFWSATSAQSGATLTATPLAWNGAIAPGASTTFGFCANATGSNYHPTLVSVSETGSAAGMDAGADARSDGSVEAASDARPDVSADTGSDSSSPADSASADVTSSDAKLIDSASADAKPADSASADAKPADSASSDTSVDTGSGGSCTWDPTVRDGTFTEYYFSQGESQTNGLYETACGYYGTEATTNSWSSVDEVLNIANSGAAKNTYFAAIPSLTSGVWPMNDCGACIEFTGSNGAKVIATIIDECPTNGGMNPHCTEADHLDLSTSLFGATMVPGGQTNTGGDPPGGSWKFIACPITTDIVVHFNNGYTGQIYIQNMVFPVAAATANGHAMTQSTFGYWSASGINDLRGTTLVLTDTEGHVVTGTVPQSDNTTGASIGVQFPSPGTCSL